MKLSVFSTALLLGAALAVPNVKRKFDLAAIEAIEKYRVGRASKLLSIRYLNIANMLQFALHPPLLRQQLQGLSTVCAVKTKYNSKLSDEFQWE